MEIIQQVQKRNIISLASIVDELKISEGDFLRLEVIDGSLVIKPIAWHEKSQEYFWNESVQEKLKQSQKDIEEGNYVKFESLEQFAEMLEKGIDNE